MKSTIKAVIETELDRQSQLPGPDALGLYECCTTGRVGVDGQLDLVALAGAIEEAILGG